MPVRGDVGRLTVGLREGDEASWRVFLDGYGERLRRYLLVVARGDFAGAEEAWQESLHRIARSGKTFDGETDFWRWLCRVGRTAWLDLCRRNGRYRSMLERFREQRQALAVERDETTVDRLGQALERALARLEAADRDLLQRKYFEGVCVRELAVETGVSEKAVESRLTRARERLREQMRKEMAS